MTRRSVPLVSVALAATLFTLTGCAGSDSPSAAESVSPTATGTTAESSTGPTESPAQTAAAWLVTAADGAPLLQTEFDGVTYDDYGLTADVALALLAAGDSAAAEPFVAALAAPETLAMYVGDGASAQYAGATAKLLATLVTAGLNGTDLGGRDLVAELLALQAPSGRFSDLGADDYSTTVSQAWALLALGATDGAPQTAVDYLTAQQCTGEGFPIQLADVSPVDCASDVDATAFAVAALLDAGVPASAPAVAESLAWLEATSATDEAGQYWVAAGTTDPNVNSTALVAVALTDAGSDSAAATGWLESQMLTGADAGAFPLAGAPDTRTSAQATFALAGTGFSSLLG